jgi:hypothetical protein
LTQILILASCGCLLVPALLAGLGGDAKSVATKDEAKTFADPSVAALADVVKIGWACPVS